MLTKVERDEIRDEDFVRCGWGRIFRIVEQLCDTSDELERQLKLTEEQVEVYRSHAVATMKAEADANQG